VNVRLSRFGVVSCLCGPKPRSDRYRDADRLGTGMAGETPVGDAATQTFLKGSIVQRRLDDFDGSDHSIRCEPDLEQDAPIERGAASAVRTAAALAEFVEPFGDRVREFRWADAARFARLFDPEAPSVRADVRGTGESRIGCRSDPFVRTVGPGGFGVGRTAAVLSLAGGDGPPASEYDRCDCAGEPYGCGVSAFRSGAKIVHVGSLSGSVCAEFQSTKVSIDDEGAASNEQL